MLSLWADLRAYWLRKPEYSILILGLDGAGKTTLLERVKQQLGQRHEPLDRVVPTVGQNVGKFDIAGVRIKLWDLGGQASLRSLWPRYFDDAHLICFVVDSSDSGRLMEACSALRVVGEELATRVSGIPVLVLANKRDRDDVLPLQDIKDQLNPVIEIIDPREGGVLTSSGLDGTGVREALDWMVSRVKRNKSERPPVLR